ncbi:MAG TPA: AMP-binding protein [Burkholderiales bacterium]|nr:AMP-binding protein [Burkholderiales bacterium]
MNLPDLLSGDSHEVALIDRERRVTYAELDAESRRVASGLIEVGIREGDRVALWLPNNTAWLACFFACAHVGAIALAVNTRFRSGELTDILGRSGAKALVLWPGFRGIDFNGILEAVDPAALSALDVVVAYGEGDETVPVTIAQRRAVAYRDIARSSALETTRARPDAGVLLFTTSGTTSKPKLVLHDQRSLARHAFDVARAFGFDAPDATILLPIPLCGTFGLTAALGAIAARRPLVMLPTFDAQSAASLIRKHAVTHFPAAGDIVAQLLASSDEPRPYPSVRLVIGARTGQAARAERRGLTLVGVYGMSEVQAMVSRHYETDPPEKRELGGGQLIATDARVRARDTATGRILPHGESGELEFRMPSAMTGYFGNQEATRAVFTDDGFVASGDLGYTVEGGFVFQSRMGDALRLSGFPVNPLEIEETINAVPGVAASQVVGIDGERGTYAVAFVVAQAGAVVDEQTVIAHCASRIAGYKAPKRVFTIDAFPVTHSANGTKVQKGRLRELAVERLRSDG